MIPCSFLGWSQESHLPVVCPDLYWIRWYLPPRCSPYSVRIGGLNWGGFLRMKYLCRAWETRFAGLVNATNNAPFHERTDTNNALNRLKGHLPSGGIWTQTQ